MSWAEAGFIVGKTTKYAEFPNIPAMTSVLLGASATTILNYSGSGLLDYIFLGGSTSGTGNTAKITVTIDGNTIINNQSLSAGTTYAGYGILIPIEKKFNSQIIISGLNQVGTMYGMACYRTK